MWFTIIYQHDYPYAGSRLYTYLTLNFIYTAINRCSAMLELEN